MKLKFCYKLYIFIFILFCFSGYGNVARAEGITAADSGQTNLASIYLTPDYNLFFDADYLYVDVIVNPAGQAINASEFSLSFDTGYLAIDSVDYANSYCQFFPEQTVDNANGFFYAGCGSASSATTTAVMARIKFNKLRAGTAKIILSDSALLLADGLGTKITVGEEAHFFQIIK